MTRINQSFPRISFVASISALLLSAACGSPSDDSADGSADSLGSVTQELAANVAVSGSNAADVSPTITGNGFISVVNNGKHVAATQTGIGSIDIVNNGRALTATNTGTGVMTIDSTATGKVTVTNTGNGNVTVRASGSAPVTVTHTGNEDFTSP
jgi:hypothetical protein